MCHSSAGGKAQEPERAPRLRSAAVSGLHPVFGSRSSDPNFPAWALRRKKQVPAQAFRDMHSPECGQRLSVATSLLIYT
jgi:hypothetical protein